MFYYGNSVMTSKIKTPPLKDSILVLMQVRLLAKQCFTVTFTLFPDAKATWTIPEVVFEIYYPASGTIDAMEEFLRRISNLRVDRVRGPAKPYKPLLLLAVILLIEKGKIADRHIFLDGALRSVFHQLLRHFYPKWPFKAEAVFPFRHLENDRVWELVPNSDESGRLVALREAKAKARELMKSVSCARLDADIFDALAASHEKRLEVISLLVEKYLPASGKQVAAELIGESISEDQIEEDLHNEDLQKQRRKVTNSERFVEEYLFNNWSGTPFSQMDIKLSEQKEQGFPGRQVVTPVNNIDLLGWQALARTWWVFELKRGDKSDRVVGQVSRYLGWLQTKRRTEGERARGVVLTDVVDDKLRYAVEPHPNLELWIYDDDYDLHRVAGPES
jgi:hypothetical protein